MMVVLLFILKLFVPVAVSSRILNILVILLYAAVGGVFYLIFTFKVGIVKNVFGDRLEKILKKKK